MNKIICGIDEAGRGPLAGPVTAAAVILPDDFEVELLNDSKKLSEKKRLVLEELIKQKSIAWSVIHIPHNIIDEINILNASLLAMKNAFENLATPDGDFYKGEVSQIIVDGIYFPKIDVDESVECITKVKADATEPSVMAASILAISCLTDALDGILARKLHMISKFGKFLDPLADKATQCALTICLAIRYPVLWFLMAIFVVKESFQLLAGIIELRKGRMLIGALPSGKICTSFLFLSFILLVLFPHISSTIVILLTMIDSIFLLMSFANYAIVYHLKYNHFENIEKFHDNSI